MNFRHACISLLMVAIAPLAASADITVDFSDQTLKVPPYENGQNLTGAGFTSQGVFFNNSYDTTYGSWSGWSLSDVNNSSTAGYSNQYAAITGTAPGGSGLYAVAYDGYANGSYFNLPAGSSAQSLEVTNTTYAYLSMLHGDQFAKQFSTGDFFLLTITGYTGSGATGSSVGSINVYLANYTAPDNTPLSTWQTIGLSSLASATSIGFSLSSSDNSTYGGISYMNTPAYFAMDNLVISGASAVPEPTSMALFALGLVGFAIVRMRNKELNR